MSTTTPQAELAAAEASLATAATAITIARTDITAALAAINAPATTPPATTTPPAASAAPVPVGIPGSWKLIADQEFSTQTVLDETFWRPGWFSSSISNPVNTLEVAAYNADNVTLVDGNLSLALTNTPIKAPNGQTYQWTGALVNSNPHDGRASGGFEFTYGVTEYRIYIPGTSEIDNWPAVWQDGQAWPTDGEDDTMEGLDGSAAYHFHDPSGGPGATVANVKPGWHTFASDWQPGSVTYYYDGVDVGSITSGVTSEPQYLIIDYTSSGTPAPVAEAMLVAYARVWQAA